MILPAMIENGRRRAKTVKPKVLMDNAMSQNGKISFSYQGTPCNVKCSQSLEFSMAPAILAYIPSSQLFNGRVRARHIIKAVETI